MPIPISQSCLVCETYSQPSTIPSRYLDGLERDQRNANIIYPHLLKALEEEHAGLKSTYNAWLVFLSYPNLSTNPTVNYIVAVTKGALGNYPIFIYHPQPITGINPSTLNSQMKVVARELSIQVPQQRVFSVFAAESVTRAFANAWRATTGVDIARGLDKSDSAAEYYAALLTYCDKESFRDRRLTINPKFQYDIRQAQMSDLPVVADLCYEFAALSEPFVLSREAAEKEASLYIRKNQMWVHGMTHADGTTGIASICAVTRTSSQVAGITKVFTNSNYRQMGCAERLVRAVCGHYLKFEEKESLILYVAHDNPAARSVYRRVGFRGLDNPSEEVPGVERWLELGFDRQVVELGHW